MFVGLLKWPKNSLESEQPRTAPWPRYSRDSLAGQPLATPTTGRGESGQVPIIISCLTCQEFLGVLSGFNSVRLPFSTLVRELTSCASMLYYYTHAQLCSHPLS